MTWSENPIKRIGKCFDLSFVQIPVIRNLPVGRNLQDHIGAFGLNFLVKKGLAVSQDRYENVPTILKYYLKGEGEKRASITRRISVSFLYILGFCTQRRIE